MSEHKIAIPSHGEVSAILLLPEGALSLLVLAHGAGAGMRHRAMQAIADTLAAEGIATLRYNFPYMEQGGGPPNSKPTLLATVRAAVQMASDLTPGLPLIAGGKSMGGRMTSMAQAEAPLPGVKGLVFYGFPLHPAGRPGIDRADHLFVITQDRFQNNESPTPGAEVRRAIPMLFLQGTRDALAEPELLRPICQKLGPLATLREIEGADHSFHVPKSNGKTDRDVLEELARTVQEFASMAETGCPKPGKNKR